MRSFNLVVVIGILVGLESAAACPNIPLPLLQLSKRSHCPAQRLQLPKYSEYLDYDNPNAADNKRLEVGPENPLPKEKHIARPKVPRTRPASMARVYADVNAQMPRAYWDYDSVNISWGILENYEVVRKIGSPSHGSALLKPSR